jgi:uncharacterized membrane protein YqjE
MADSSARGGLLASLRALLATGIGILQTRLELLVVELEEEKARVFGLLAFGAIGVILFAAGLVFIAVFFTVLLWDNNRLLALGMFSVLFLGGGIACLLVARHHARTRSGLFAGSLAELAKDRAAAEADDDVRLQ